MEKTATEWKETAAETFYSKGGLSLFGMSESDFTRDKQSAAAWMNGVLGVFADGKPKKAALIKEWTDSFKGLTAEHLASYQGPTYAMLELEFGVRMVRAEEKIRAVLPDAEQAELLRVTTGTPLLSVERISYTYNDVPMELRRGLYRTDTHHYHNTLI